MPEVMVRLPVTGSLDTANPVSGLPPGVLRQAVGLHNRQFGPHRGPAVFTWPRTGMTTLPGVGWRAFVLDATKYISGDLTCVEQRDTGCRWTAHAVVSHWDKTVTSADQTICGLLRKASTYTLRVQIQGTGSANPGALKITISTADNDSGGTTYTITCTTDLRALDCPVLRIRVVRDGAAGYVYVNGVQHYYNASVFSRSVPHTGPSATLAAKWFIGDVSGSNSLPCVVNGFWMIDSVDLDDLYSMTPPSLLSPGLRFYVSSYSRVSTTRVEDWSSYKAHGAWTGGVPASFVDDRGFVTPQPVLGMGSFTDHLGRTWNIVCCGGTFYYQRVKA